MDRTLIDRRAPAGPAIAVAVPAGSPQGMLSLAYEPDSGIIRVVGSGLWSTDYVDAFFRDLEAFMTGHRRRFPAIRTLVDLRPSGPQTFDVSQRIEYWTRRIHVAEDRVALVLTSSLLKMQVKRTNEASITRVFAMIDEARDWLLAI